MDKQKIYSLIKENVGCADLEAVMIFNGGWYSGEDFYIASIEKDYVSNDKKLEIRRNGQLIHTLKVT